jgi:hypothetical protein
VSLTPNYEWKHRAEFAEIAESLGIPTDLIMAALPYRNRVTVMFTPTGEPDSPVWAAVFRRGEGRLLKQVGPMRLVAPSAQELFNQDEIRQHIEREVQSMPLAKEGDDDPQETQAEGEHASDEADEAT